MIWYLIVVVHATNCIGKCGEVPMVTVQMPSQDVCVAVKALNPDEPLECWAKPGPAK